MVPRAVASVASMLARFHDQRAAAVAFSAWAAWGRHLRLAVRALSSRQAVHQRFARGVAFRLWADVTFTFSYSSCAGAIRSRKQSALQSTSWRDWAGRECGCDSYQRFDAVRGIIQMLCRPFAQPQHDRRTCGTALRRCIPGQQGSAKEEGWAAKCWPWSREELQQVGADICDCSSFSFMGPTSMHASSYDDSSSSPLDTKRSAQSWTDTFDTAAESSSTESSMSSSGAGSVESFDSSSPLACLTDRALLSEVAQLRSDIVRLQRVTVLSAAQSPRTDGVIASGGSPEFGGRECSPLLRAALLP